MVSSVTPRSILKTLEVHAPQMCRVSSAVIYRMVCGDGAVIYRMVRVAWPSWCGLRWHASRRGISVATLVGFFGWVVRFLSHAGGRELECEKEGVGKD